MRFHTKRTPERPSDLSQNLSETGKTRCSNQYLNITLYFLTTRFSVPEICFFDLHTVVRRRVSDPKCHSGMAQTQTAKSGFFLGRLTDLIGHRSPREKRPGYTTKFRHGETSQATLRTQSARDRLKSTPICNWKTRTQVIIVRKKKSAELSLVLGEEQRQKVKSAGSSRPLYRDFTPRVTQSVIGDRNQGLPRFSSDSKGCGG